MIIIMTQKERIGKTNKYEILVSHGINSETDEIIIMPQIPIRNLGGSVIFEPQIGEYVIKN